MGAAVQTVDSGAARNTHKRAYLALLPPILVAITGALFCKRMFRRIAAEVLLERQELGEAPSA